MPNGYGKNWIRFCAALEGFYVKHGHWPTRVRAFPWFVEDLASMFSDVDFEKISEKLEMVPDKAPFVAEDADGNTYNYGDEGFPKVQPDMSADEWLDVKPLH